MRRILKDKDKHDTFSSLIRLKLSQVVSFSIER